MTVTVKIAAFCDVTVCSLVDMSVIRVDDRGNRMLSNICAVPPDYMALHLRRRQCF
jgi:hypothetical protein